MSWRQVKLVSHSNKDKVTELVCWVEDDRRLRPGSMVKLKGEDEWWRVESTYSVVLDFPPETRWRVGGLT